MAKNGFIAARVEYTKTSGDRHIAITHAGAQVAARTVFMPEMWAIRLSAFDAQGRFKRGEKVPQGRGRSVLLRRRHHRSRTPAAAARTG